MLNHYVVELEQDPFDGEEFVERLAWRIHTNAYSQAGNASTNFDPDLLNDAFVDAIRDLKLLDERMAKRCDKLEQAVAEEETQHWLKIKKLLDQNKEAFKAFQELDSHINSVATKVVHLGDQLENVNTPRSRAVEAQRLMNHFAEFLAGGPLISEVFTDKASIYEAADIIQKLHLIAQELPSGKFEEAKEKIMEKYKEIEGNLIEEFVVSYQDGDRESMKKIASTLSFFKGYSQCESAFIEECQRTKLKSHNIFAEVVPLCMKSESLMREVFSNPDQVISKFVISIFQNQLKEHIQVKLEHKSSSEQYLQSLYNLYSQTNRLCTELQALNLGADTHFLPKLTKQIFQQYLASYMSVETRYLREKFKILLMRYYDAKGHQKKVIHSGGINEIREKIQDVINSKANFNIGYTVESYGGETFLSEEVAISLLEESKHALKRCQLLSNQSEVPSNGMEIFDLLTNALLIEHVDYAIELGLQNIPGGDPRSPPELTFCEIVQQSSSMINLLDKLFNDSLLPLIMSSAKFGECIQRKKQLMTTLEQKLDLGLDKCLSVATSYARYLLTTEQKRSDFKPDNDDVMIGNASSACHKVVRWVSQSEKKLRDSLDGHNLETVLLELGLRLHRSILEHLMKFEYNTTGAMAVICDVNEYRKAVASFKQPLVNTVFDTLHTLCKLLQVSPENLKMVCSGDQLSGLDRTILASFIQLRADYKTAKLGNQIK